METLKAYRPDRAQFPKIHPAGRLCTAPGCETKLSRYNSASTCYAHTLLDVVAYGKGGGPYCA